MFGAKVMQNNGTAKKNFQSPLFAALAGVAGVSQARTETIKEIEEEIADAIAYEADGGSFYVTVEHSGVTVECSGTYELDGYWEDDYYNGTGQWVATSASVEIEELAAYRGEEEVTLPFDESHIERMAENGLMEF